jgi:hypothetical protein
MNSAFPLAASLDVIADYLQSSLASEYQLALEATDRFVGLLSFGWLVVRQDWDRMPWEEIRTLPHHPVGEISVIWDQYTSTLVE